jgi:LemA protein
LPQLQLHGNWFGKPTTNNQYGRLMSSIFGFISSVFWFLFWVALILGAIGLFSYNKLQKLAQEVKEKSSNIQVAVSKKVQMVNQLGDLVRSFQQAEQLTQLKISQDNTAQAVAGAYHESGQMLATIQSVAARFPDLKANEQYHRLIDSIQHCESNIEQRRNQYNAAVKDYNGARSSIPFVFVARALGFPTAPHLEFNISGAEENAMRPFETPDGEHLAKLLGNTGASVAGGMKKLTKSAVEVGSIMATKAVDAVGKATASNTERYFYMAAGGGVPKGPLTLQDIEGLVASGAAPAAGVVAREGSDTWQPLSDTRVSPGA